MFNTIDEIMAQTVPGPEIDARFGTIGHISGIIINLIIGVGFGLGIFAITLSMLMYILSGGNPDHTKKAWRAFIFGVIGTALSIATFALKNIVVRVFGIDDPNILNVPTF